MVVDAEVDEVTVHYHGGPIWGGKDCPTDWLIKALYMDSGALVSFARMDQLKKIVNIPCKLVLDNGAFSKWKKAKSTGKVVCWDAEWEKYYDVVGQWYSRIEWFIIPDVIEGTEEENDRLIEQVPAWLMDKAVPVWHSIESLERLLTLCKKFDRVAIGCCGPHGSIRSKAWKARMDEVFDFLLIQNYMEVKLHGLRMLDGRALSMYPFDSADSTNVATNVPKTKVRFPEITDKLARTVCLKTCIEKVKPPSVHDWLMNKIFSP